jgi:hypothetical protein
VDRGTPNLSHAEHALASDSLRGAALAVEPYAVGCISAYGGAPCLDSPRLPDGLGWSSSGRIQRGVREAKRSRTCGSEPFRNRTPD